jgi:hypothetical protein
MNAKTRKKLRNRKYGTAVHQRTRQEYSSLVAAGLIDCARCGEPIEPGTPWDLGHDDQFPQYYSGPEHTWCNRGAPHKNVTSREW